VPTVSPIVDVDLKAIEGVLERAQPLLLPEDFGLIRGLVDTLVRVTKLVRARGSTIARLRRLFGLSGSEKTRDIVGPSETTGPAPKAVEPAPGVGPAAQTSPSGNASNGDVLPPPTDVGTPGAQATPDTTPTPTEKPKRKGHGRVAAADYLAAEHIHVPHESLQHGDPCPRCERGKVNELKQPAPILRIVGQPPLGATCWDCARLRCGACGHLYTARAPEEAKGEKYDETAVSMIAIVHYGAGMPFHRLDRLQRNLDTPLPASTQWDLVDEGCDLVEPACDEFLRAAAQGKVLHNDDSYMRILELMGKRRAKLLASGMLPDPERTGLFTTAVVSIVPAIGTIALFFTGRKHAGENLALVLDKRAKDLPPPIQMGDALTRNLPLGHEVIASNCIAHGRRKIVDEIDNYPVECRFIIERLALVYKLDDECKARGVSDEERLLAHQTSSAPLMEEVRAHMAAELAEKRIEPNSDLGQAFKYFLKRWENFTLFLRKPGAPLDNNIAERALKMTIRHRKASLFYRSQRGAHVGDVFMTLIHTAELHHQNPFEYLTALQRNYKAVAEKPADWMPWNYRRTLADLKAEVRLVPAMPDAAIPLAA
jgi:transposase